MYRKMGTKPGLPVARVRMVNVSFLLDVLWLLKGRERKRR
jgi:hypothetical protein